MDLPQPRDVWGTRIRQDGSGWAGFFNLVNPGASLKSWFKNEEGEPGLVRI